MIANGSKSREGRDYFTVNHTRGLTGWLCPHLSSEDKIKSLYLILCSAFILHHWLRVNLHVLSLSFLLLDQRGARHTEDAVDVDAHFDLHFRTVSVWLRNHILYWETSWWMERKQMSVVVFLRAVIIYIYSSEEAGRRQLVVLTDNPPEGTHPSHKCSHKQEPSVVDCALFLITILVGDSHRDSATMPPYPKKLPRTNAPVSLM